MAEIRKMKVVYPDDEGFDPKNVVVSAELTEAQKKREKELEDKEKKKKD